MINGRLNGMPVQPLSQIDDRNRRQGLDALKVETGLPRGQRCGIVEMRHGIETYAERSLLGGMEGIGHGRMRLGGIIAGMNAVIHDDHDAARPGIGMRRQSHGLHEIARTIRADGG